MTSGGTDPRGTRATSSAADSPQRSAADSFPTRYLPRPEVREMPEGHMPTDG